MQSTLRGILFLLLGGMGVVLGAMPASAQNTTTTTGKVGRPFRAKIGGFYPSEGPVKDNTGSTIRSVGLSYDMFATKTTLPLIAGVYVSDSGRSSKRTFGNVSVGTETTITGIGIQGRTYFIPNSKTFDFFAGGGVGFYAISVKTGVPDKKTFIAESKDSTRLGGKVFGGVEWKKRFFGELEYTFPGSVQVGGKEFILSGLNISLGSRF